MYFRFEKDLLNRTKEVQESSKDVFISSKSNINLDQEKNISEQNANNSDNEEWKFNYVCDSITNESPKGGECLKYMNNNKYLIFFYYFYF